MTPTDKARQLARDVFYGLDHIQKLSDHFEFEACETDCTAEAAQDGRIVKQISLQVAAWGAVGIVATQHMEKAEELEVILRKLPEEARGGAGAEPGEAVCRGEPRTCPTCPDIRRCGEGAAGLLEHLHAAGQALNPREHADARNHLEAASECLVRICNQHMERIRELEAALQESTGGARHGVDEAADGGDRGRTQAARTE